MLMLSGWLGLMLSGCLGIGHVQCLIVDNEGWLLPSYWIFILLASGL